MYCLVCFVFLVLHVFFTGVGLLGLDGVEGGYRGGRSGGVATRGGVDLADRVGSQYFYEAILTRLGGRLKVGGLGLGEGGNRKYGAVVPKKSSIRCALK